MKRTIRTAMLAAGLLVAGGLSAQAAAVSPNVNIRANEPIQLAQMNSPGDGLTPGAARSGNGRPRMHGHYRRHHHWHHRHHWRHHRHHRHWR
ncbi:hypothetical protein [Methylobacterium brachythecii]|uniref:Opacity protein-like surface antigen n=1 Tax=Methylobacterium brachythecii TaxID=1176177 RepID=A0A7W6ADD3_9HYPH|nr:hypothetical protein [Methylobacterium brachythecii]MBB3901182.1 opacity protein-like surface antigen [Methylobacterium brachythecii]